MTDTAKPPVRINEVLEQYWQGLQGGRPMPFEHELNAADVSAIWPSCFLVTVRKDRFAYDYLGQDLIEAYGDDLTGHEIAETLVYPHPPSLFAAFKNVCETQKPQMDDNEFTNKNGILVKYRSCVLPLAAKGREGVAFILGGMKWKAYAGEQ